MIRLRKILFPTDFSDLSTHALDYARSFAEAYQAELHVLHVVDESCQYWMTMGPNSLPVGPPPDELIEAGNKELSRLKERHMGDAAARVVLETVLGRPFMEIIRYARDHDIDLIVLGTHGRSGLEQMLLGSVAEKVVRKAPCPVLTIRHPEHEFVMP